MRGGLTKFPLTRTPGPADLPSAYGCKYIRLVDLRTSLSCVRDNKYQVWHYRYCVLRMMTAFPPVFKPAFGCPWLSRAVESREQHRISLYHNIVYFLNSDTSSHDGPLMLKPSTAYQRERCIQEQQGTILDVDARGAILSPNALRVIKPTRPDIDPDRSMKRADLLRWGEPYPGSRPGRWFFADPKNCPMDAFIAAATQFYPRRWSFGRTVGAICATSTQIAF